MKYAWIVVHGDTEEQAFRFIDEHGWVFESMDEAVAHALKVRKDGDAWVMKVTPTHWFPRRFYGEDAVKSG